MSIDLTIAGPISGTLQPVQDQNNNASGLAIATNSVAITGQDVVGGALPLIVTGTKVTQGESMGRLIRLAGATPGVFYDLGIDAKGNLFLNGPGSTASQHLLTVSPNGVVTIGS